MVGDISVIRSEDRYFWKAIEEIIQVGKEASIPVQISHIKLAMVSLLGKTNKLLARLNQAGKMVSGCLQIFTPMNIGSLRCRFCFRKRFS